MSPSTATANSMIDQVDLMLHRCGYSKHVVDPNRLEDDDVVYRNMRSKRELAVMWTEAGVPEYTLITGWTMPQPIINAHVADPRSGVKHCTGDELIALFLAYVKIAEALGIDPVHTGAALDLFRYRAHSVEDETTRYRDILALVACTSLDYKDLEKLMLNNVPISEITRYARLNPTLIMDLLMREGR